MSNPIEVKSTLKPAYDHVIVGGGVAADKAARAIREEAPEASVLIISDVGDGPLYRPGLSKDLWLKAGTTLEDIDLGTTQTGAELLLGTTVTALDPASHTVTTSDDQQIRYGRLLLATGASARRIDTPDDDRIVYYRNADDYRHLRSLVSEGTRVAIVGGGYIASEIAAGLSAVGADVSVHFPNNRLLEQMFPDSITGHLTEVYESKGVSLNSGFRLSSIRAGRKLTLEPETGEAVEADVVVLGLGAIPNVRLAEEAGLEMEQGGVLVDETLQTSAPDVYAAGDIATFEDPLLGRRRVEHMANAERSGDAAGRTMAGNRTGYRYTPLFWSDLFDDGYEALGETRTSHRVEEVWNDAHDAAVLYYLDGDRVRGVLMWNTWGAVSKAREVMEASKEGQLPLSELADRITPGG
ncbi:NAD(P)/FAD-dependent oxidoreductase [Corynebacterium marinum]|uniref:FAD-dependent pyridine nucleotide-disulfide oxidoreductase n=1 Tax=Corynebacterium marinum DSM 44953 TaxID=1224162 RepID=A0A0B6TRH9_9CORY|nr:FAD/NAD(P)-binding oxidoreductase [Corynebacterium marinum]AJK68839.1 FAD-dependent pyridine nucleotide-disulfide oxidoreductase [Corynebacterium marinum DSM 44953]GGO21179.1 N-acylamino acid racemase [Corynebacterium marinum]